MDVVDLEGVLNRHEIIDRITTIGAYIGGGLAAIVGVAILIAAVASLSFGVLIFGYFAACLIGGVVFGPFLLVRHCIVIRALRPLDPFVQYAGYDVRVEGATTTHTHSYQVGMTDDPRLNAAIHDYYESRAFFDSYSGELFIGAIILAVVIGLAVTNGGS